ncbi:MAG: hypothetical protein E6J90_49480 [Deltaproteobacteria bacterium]|nr:MAG: hypothetical protein E6J90_49480 [Deltaproteobacteria bacterium]
MHRDADLASHRADHRALWPRRHGGRVWDERRPARPEHPDHHRRRLRDARTRWQADRRRRDAARLRSGRHRAAAAQRRAAHRRRPRPPDPPRRLRRHQQRPDQRQRHQALGEQRARSHRHHAAAHGADRRSDCDFLDDGSDDRVDTIKDWIIETVSAWDAPPTFGPPGSTGSGAGSGANGGPDGGGDDGDHGRATAVAGCSAGPGTLGGPALSLLALAWLRRRRRALS